MSIDECKEAYEMLKKSNQFIANIDKDFFLKFAETVLSELEMTKAIANEMSKELVGYIYFDEDDYDSEAVLNNEEEVIEYFKKKFKKKVEGK